MCGGLLHCTILHHATIATKEPDNNNNNNGELNSIYTVYSTVLPVSKQQLRLTYLYT